MRGGRGALIGYTPLRWVVAGFVALLIGAAAILWLAAAYTGLNDRFEASNDERGKLVKDVESLREQVIDNGKVPVVPPPSNSTDSPSNDALTDQQVTAIARDVVNQSGLTSRPVVQALIDAAVANVQSRPGPPPTRDVVLATTKPIVTAYLKANPPQPGKPGPTGAPGTTGATGEPGKDGADGQPGKDGADGVGIVTAAFDKESCTIVQTLSNGTSQSFGPLCGTDGVSAVPVTILFKIPGNGPLGKDTVVRCDITKPDVVTDCTTEDTPSDEASVSR